MTRNDAEERQAELNELIEAFEAAHAGHEEVDLTEFLPAPDHPLYLEARRELLRVDLELSWRDGRRRRISEYLEQFRDLLQDRRTIQEISYEEFRLRTLAGEAPAPAEYEERYGVTTTGWAPSAEPNPEPDPGTEIALFLDIARSLSGIDEWHSSRHGDAAQTLLRQNAHQSSAEAEFLLAQAMTALPEVGSTFLSFRLIAELGHGSFGRVYLARQGDLANRRVALKITVDLLGEEQKLAQLQHTNVVPVYSVHQAGPFQAVCMPFFGPTTLLDVTRAIQNQPTMPTSGKEIVRTLRDRKAAFLALVHEANEAAGEGNEAESGLDRGVVARSPDRATSPATLRGAVARSPERATSPATLKMLEESSYVGAILWIAECVTEALIHAHERGILHRDLKPANVLLTDEGRPMLVDFNLSADVKLHTGLSELQVGGTLPYMASEILEAMKTPGRTTDARSDLFALGVVLFELLTGRLPFETRSGHLSAILQPMIADRLQTPPRLRRWNSAVSPAVESIVRHCLQPDPAKRYQSAAELHEDLKRQQHHRPLRFAPEPSIRERARKWVRRHPRLTSPSSIGCMAIFFVLCCMAPDAWRTWDKWQQAILNAKTADEKTDWALQKASQAEGTAIVEKQKASVAEETAKASQILIKFRDFEKADVTSRPIMEIASIMQILPEAWPYEEKRLAAAVAECRQCLQTYRVLEDPAWQRQPAVDQLPALEREQLRRRIAELLFALAHVERIRVVRHKEQSHRDASARAAWEIQLTAAISLNEQAMTCFGDLPVPRYLLFQRGEFARLQGNLDDMKQLVAKAMTMPPSADRDESYWTAIDRVTEEKFDAAQKLLDAATERSRDHAGAWLLLGWCHYHQRDPTREPSKREYLKGQEPFLNYLNLRPESIWGLYVRGLYALVHKNWELAKQDFSIVQRKRPDLASPYARRAWALEKMHLYPQALSDLNKAIDRDESVPEFYLQRSRVLTKINDHEKAEADIQAFLKFEPRNYDGWLSRGAVRFNSDTVGALKDFEQALVLKPNCPLTLWYKARLLADSSQTLNDALKVLNDILVSDPDYSNARYTRGLLLAKMGQGEKAVEDAEELTKRDPTPSHHYEAATIYAVTSRKDRKDAERAIHHLRYALRHDFGADKYRNDPHFLPLANIVEFRRLAEGVEILGAGTGLPPRMRPKTIPD